MGNKLSELSKPVAWTDAEELRGLEKHSCAYMFIIDHTNPYHDPRRQQMLYSQEYVSALLADNEYMHWRIKEMDLLFGQMLLTMQAAVIEIEYGEGPAAAMQWIVNKLMGPGEFAPDSEKDAQAYFNRESEKIDTEYSKVMDFYKQYREAKLATPVVTSSNFNGINQEKMTMDKLSELTIAFNQHIETAGLNDDDEITVRECRDALAHVVELIGDRQEAQNG